MESNQSSNMTQNRSQMNEICNEKNQENIKRKAASDDKHNSFRIKKIDKSNEQNTTTIPATLPP